MSYAKHFYLICVLGDNVISGKLISAETKPITDFFDKINIKFYIPGRVRFLVDFQGDEVLGEHIRRELHKIPEIRLRSYSAFSRTALITYDPKTVSLERVTSALFRGIEVFWSSHAGCIIGESHTKQHSKRYKGNSACGDSCGDSDVISQSQIRREIGKLALVGVFATYLIGRRIFRGKAFISPSVFYFSTAVTILAGLPIIRSGFNTLRKGKRPNDDTLVTLAVVSSLVMRDALTGLSIMWLINVGRLLERITLMRSQSAIKDLLDITPKEAEVIIDDKVKKIPVSQVQKGQYVRVFESFSVPLDGKISRGCGAFQESILTGESLPVEKSVGDFVYAGTVLLSGEVDIEVINRENETAVAKMIESVENMRHKRGEIELYGDRFVAKFIPISMATSVIVFLITRDWQRAIASLVIACPCAVGLATPAAVAAGITEAAKKGILIKGGTHLEAAANVSAVVFDKTGTLTSGHPSVSQVYFSPEILKKMGTANLWSIIGGCEQHSTHPIAKAIIAEASRWTSDIKSPSKFKNMPGRGILAEIGSEDIILGNMQMLREHQVNLSREIQSKVESEEYRLLTTVFIAIDKQVVGLIGVEDKVRPDALTAMRSLRKLGISQLSLVSGDKKEIVESLAKQLGIEQFVGETLPHDKYEYVQNMKRSGYKVMMVGDGVNDAQALAAADVSIAHSSGRCDLAIETADITLAKENLLLIPQTVDLSRQTYKTIRQNFTASVAVNILGLAISATGALSPFTAALVHNMSTITVVLNSLRLKKSIHSMENSLRS